MINMDNITFEQAEAGHRELWDRLAETGGDLAYKSIWPGWGGYNRRANFLCFACEISIKFTDCERCPIEWPDDNICDDGDNLYHMWCVEKDPAARKRLAEQIRDLPWREK
ncbi:MAG: hypothetical protein LBS24_00640 [Clostridiales Family XIII bacterium]|jgi:hypothetical protein|nr:hypothetical protein [Clostridiales Family XIII bacterium]